MKVQREERLRERQDESRQLLVEAVRQDDMGGDVEKAVDFEDMPDDDDEEDELGDYEEWKVRELKRVRRERAAAEREAKELERRRNLTDEERKREDEEFAKGRHDYKQEKAQWKFLQKYYHRGAYFQEEDEQ